MLSTTLAVFRPTPGSDSSASRSAGTSPPKLLDQDLAQREDVLGLVAIEPDGLDQLGDPLDAERDHLLRRVGELEQRRRRLVDPGIGRLRRQHHRDQQRESVGRDELALGLGIGALRTPRRSPRPLPADRRFVDRLRRFRHSQLPIEAHTEFKNKCCTTGR